jgi:uncharacterized protein (TIGR02145 family)
LQNYLIANGYNWDGTTTDNKIAKSLAAKTDWKTDTAAGTIGNDLTKNNRSGFSALPGGFRVGNGNFFDIGNNGYWWSATKNVELKACYGSLYCDKDFLLRHSIEGRCGLSARLLRD